MKNRFSVGYSYGYQRLFLGAIETEDADKADKILERIPSSRNTLEELERVVLLSEGYRMLFENLKQKIFDESSTSDEQIREILDKIKRYSVFGEPEQIHAFIKQYEKEMERLSVEFKAIKEEVIGYRKLGSLEELASAIKEKKVGINCDAAAFKHQLDRYEALGSVEYMETIKGKLEEYRELGTIGDLKAICEAENELKGKMEEAKLTKNINTHSLYSYIVERLERLEEYENLGSEKEIEENMDALHEYIFLGNLEVIKKRLKTLEDMESRLGM